MDLGSLFIELLCGLNLDVQLMDLRIGRTSVFNLNILVRLILHGQIVELFSDLLVLVSESVQLFLVV